MKSTTERAALLSALLAAPLAAAAEVSLIEVEARAETAGTTGDADDPAIWANPADPAASLILGTDKEAGLRVYDLDGTELAFFPDGKLNNVDLRPFILAGKPVTLASAARRDDDTMAFYVIEGGTVRQAEPFTLPALTDAVPGLDDIYGSAMASWNGKTYVIVNFKSGHVLQFELGDEAGRLTMTLVRHWSVASQPEGMVADDLAGHLYVGEEDVGIWRFPLDPGAAAEPLAIDRIPSTCLPRDDVEGLALYDGLDGRFLVASAQGIHRATIYRLEGETVPTCVAQVQVVPGPIDGVTETDGLDVTSAALPGYPEGLLVMMDDQNGGFTTNFKLVDWAVIAARLR